MIIDRIQTVVQNIKNQMFDQLTTFFNEFKQHYGSAQENLNKLLQVQSLKFYCNPATLQTKLAINKNFSISQIQSIVDEVNSLNMNLIKQRLTQDFNYINQSTTEEVAYNTPTEILDLI